MKLTEKYTCEVESVPTKPGCWGHSKITVFENFEDRTEKKELFSYERNYPSHGEDTFFPFFQNDKEYALISRNYQCLEVISLPDGKTVATEKEPGFCPVQVYVPSLDEDFDEDGGECLPDVFRNYSNKGILGYFGFVAGCYWGDDSSWKIRFVDLSQIDEGILEVREGDFDYSMLPGGSDLGPELFSLIFLPDKDSEFHSMCESDIEVEVKIVKRFGFNLNKKPSKA